MGPSNLPNPARSARLAADHARAEREPHDLFAPAAPSARESLRQRLRIHRFLLASAFSLLYLVVLAIFHTQGKVDLATLIEASAIVVLAIVSFFLLFRLGLNRGFTDPSLTGFMFVSAVGTMLFVVYHAPETRGVFAAFFFVALMFGMLRARGTELAVLGFASLACFTLLTVVRYAGNGDAAMLRVDLLQIIVIAVTFPWLVFIGNRVKRLRDADRRKDDFLATLAHELRNPLAPIRTGIDILRTREGVAKADAVLPMMDRQVGHLTRLLDDLLDVSRIAHGKMTLHLAATDLREAVEAGVEASRPLVEHMGHALKVTLPERPVVLKADAVRLAQIVSNLLNNAARYTPPHGAIGLSAHRDGDVVEIVVRDNGIGIPAERRDSIFEMFAQVDSSQSASSGGLGIGLALVKGLVALHGGTIEARSDGPGRGSEFRVRLPARVESAPAPAVVPALPGRSTREAILVVDDHRDAAASLATLLELKGHEVIVAYDGAMAVAVAEEFRPRLVLLDLGMPGMDGYEVCREIRKRDWGREVKIVAVTGWGQDEDRHNTSMAGFDAHLVKPITADAVEQLCARLQDAAATNETKAGRS